MGGFYRPSFTETGPIPGQDPLAPLDWLGRKIVPYTPEEAAIVRTTGQLPSAQPTTPAVPTISPGPSLASALAEEPLTIKGGIAGPPQAFGDFLKESGTQTYTDANGGYVSVNRSRGLRGQDWLKSQSDLQAAALDPSGVAANPFAGRNYNKGVLFSGTGTQADLEGRAQARRLLEEAEYGPEFLAQRRELELAKAQREAEDPYGLRAYEAREEIRKGTPTVSDRMRQEALDQQRRDAAKIAQIEAQARKDGLNDAQIAETISNYIKSESIKRAFISGKYGDVARMQDPFGG